MISTLDAIIAGIAAQLKTIPELANVLTYEPDQPGPLPMVFLDMESWTFPEKPTSGLDIDWLIVGYLVIAPISAKPSEAARIARVLIPQLIDVMGQDVDAHGAIQDGQVLIRDGGKGTLIVGGTQWHARRLEFAVSEWLIYQHAL
jgi:hypothetical protein